MQEKAKEGYFEEITTDEAEKNIIGLLGFLILPFVVLGLLFSCSWVSLAFSQAIPSEDTRSKIAVDYSVWDDLVVQPVGLGIIQEVESDRKDGVDLGKIQAPGEAGWFWSTPTPILDDDNGVAESTDANASPDSTQTSNQTLTGTPPTETISLLNSETPAGTAENTGLATSTITPSVTLTSTKTPTRTLTPSASATATRTPTFTHTFTPRPTNTPGDTCSPNILNNFKGTGRQIQWNMNNISPDPYTLESLSLTWPSSNGALTRITLGEVVIWSGSDSPQVIALDPEDWLPGDRTVGAFDFERLAFTFDNATASSGYTLTIVLSVPCSLTRAQ